MQISHTQKKRQKKKNYFYHYGVITYNLITIIYFVNLSQINFILDKFNIKQ